jgi:vacuolar protein sorting-associated protein 13A/C
LNLTEVQYVHLIKLSYSIVRVLAGAPEGMAQANSALQVSPSSVHIPDSGPIGQKVIGSVAQQPEIEYQDGQDYLAVDLLVTVNAVNLRLFDSLATYETSLKSHGIARFALNGNCLAMKKLSSGAMEVDVAMKSLTMRNTRQGNTRFREIIPAVTSQQEQFKVLYTSSGGLESKSVAVITVNSPDVVFAVDPIFALVGFFTSAFPATSPKEDIPPYREEQKQSSSPVDFRVDLHDLSICILEDDSNFESQAIELSVKEMLLSQQVNSFLSRHWDRSDLSIYLRVLQHYQ